MPETLARLAQIALDGDETTVLHGTLREAAAALDGPLAQVLERRGEGGRLAVRGSLGWVGSDRAESDLPGGTGSQAGFALDEEAEEPVLLEDAAAEERFEVAEARRGIEVRSGVSCVIPGVEGPFGVLSVHSPRPHAFDREDADRLRRIALLLALALARVRSEARASELADVRGRLVAETVAAEQREGRRLAESLHDGAIQDVVTAGYDLDAALLGGGDRERLVRARQAVADALRKLRAIVQDLHPIVLDAAGLGVALERMCAEYEERADARVVLDAPRDAAGQHDRLVFELARELLGNAVRHAAASRIDVTLRREDGPLVRGVADDGRGMEPDNRAAALRAGHIGLASFAERVELAGGHLDVQSAPGRGTTVTARLPL